jgi:hypothetical protein
MVCKRGRTSRSRAVTLSPRSEGAFAEHHAGYYARAVDRFREPDHVTRLWFPTFACLRFKEPSASLPRVNLGALDRVPC